MKLSFSTLGCPQLDVEQVIKAAKTCGFDGVEIRTLGGEVDLTRVEDLKPGAIHAVRKKFEDSGIEVICINSGANYAKADPGERDRQTVHGKAYIDIAAGLGAKYVRVFGGNINRFENREEVLQWIVDGLTGLAAYAREKGVVLLLETHDDFSRGEDCRKLLDRLPRGSVEILWDILHSYRWGETFEETWKAVGAYVRHVHIKDSANFSKQGFDITFVGEGRLPVKEAVELLNSRGYKGYYSFEWEKLWHPEIPEWEAAFPHYVKIMKNQEDRS